VGAALQKLKRAEEAVETFQGASKGAPASEDALLDFYYALACYDARLYGASDALLKKTGQRAGPRVAAEAQRTRDQLAPLFQKIPSSDSVDWYLERARQLLSEGRLGLARLFLQEAVTLGERRPDHHGVAEARGLLAGNVQGRRP
jgi:hypothetical protein